VKKYLSKDEAEFLKTDLSPWDHESPPDTYQARRFDDDSGHRRGANWDDTDSHGLRNKLPDEAGDGVHGKLNVLIDNERDHRPANGLAVVARSATTTSASMTEARGKGLVGRAPGTLRRLARRAI